MRPFLSLGTWGSDYIEQWNGAPFISKVRLLVSVGVFGGYVYSMYAFLLSRLLGGKAHLDH